MSMREAWGEQHLRRFLISTGVNTWGNSIFFVSIAWVVSQSGGPTAYGYLLTAYFLGHLPLLLYAGTVVDKLPRRTVALAADLVEAAVILIAIFCLLFSWPLIPTLLVLSFLAGGVSAFSIPAKNALLPDLIDESLLSEANSIRGIVMTAAWMLGPLVGTSLLFYSNIRVCLLFDVFTFLFSAAILWTIPEVPIDREDMSGNLREEISEALSFVKTQPWLFAGILMFMFWHFWDSMIEIGIPFLVESKGLGARSYGIFGAVGAAGAMIGSALGGIRPVPKEKRGLVFYIFIGGIAWCMLFWAMPIPFWAVLIFVLLEGILGGSLMVIWRTTMSDSVDQHLRGRVNSLDAVGSLIFLPIAPLLGGWLISLTNVLTTYSIAVSFMVLTTTIGLLVPSFRNFRRSHSDDFPTTPLNSD
ncbi:MAG: MFS transporter [Candidatus Poseidoniales archaeon]|jgi:MFS family permease|nr:MFS transporter [Candidatus Poseidoniales archaeon]|tara:strand:- start:6787 stop:8031 length:1245 start_codon:yes stop_codon:yes gene_type:complete